jgi:hypothetical protein
MKKVIALLFAAFLVTGFVACGMSDEERKQDSQQMDSVKNETDNTSDSLFKMMEAQNKQYDDSVHNADSIHKADSMKNAPKK